MEFSLKQGQHNGDCSNCSSRTRFTKLCSILGTSEIFCCCAGINVFDRVFCALYTTILSLMKKLVYVVHSHRRRIGGIKGTDCPGPRAKKGP